VTQGKEESKLGGYIGEAYKKLKEAGAEPGDLIEVEKPGAPLIRGLLMPRYELEEKPIIIVKLSNGYNIGIKVTPETKIRVVKKAESFVRTPGAPAALAEPPKVLPKEKVLIVGTGGTIASRIDYETGAVKPSLDANEIVQAIPEVLKYVQLESEVIFQIFSENMTPKHWEKLAEAIARGIEKGYDGVIIAHGTDTMAYTAAALSFAFHKGLPVPVVLTGAQRSSDRPSSDSAFNLIASVIVASKAPFAEVTVVMHGETGDTYALAHRGTRVRKMHTSRRDAFQSINDLPLAKIWPWSGKIEIINERFRKRGETDLVLENGFDDKVAIVKHYPGMNGEIIDMLVDKGYHGIVIEGTGFGHVSDGAIKAIERATEEGIPVVITSQTIFGRVNLNVYSQGRKMLKAGAIPLEDMITEAAYAKLSWVLARTRDLKEVAKIMRTPLAYEIGARHNLRLYPRWYHGP
jgi:glutamyl-tRNA(Gln) amidotransferase subunit D